MSERDGYQHGVPCWIDTWQPDADAAARFYAGVFGWDVRSGSPGPTSTRYDMCQLGGRDVAAIGSPRPEGAVAAWTTYVWVDDADAAAAEAARAGGGVVVAPFDSLDGGRMAIVADPAGAALGLWQPGTHRGAQRVNEASAYAMSLLHTPDPEGAAMFYGALFGWTTEPFGEATMFRLPGFVGGEPEQPVSREVVAVMTPAGDGEPVRWDVGFWIADADAAAARAAELGGAVVAGPYDSPGFREAVLADPTGATFTVSALKDGG
jgi:uncharacterized protein